MDGVELFNILVQSTGLPENTISGWLEKKLADYEISKNNLSIEQVREILSDLLLELVNEADIATTQIEQ